jgi:hypothetical protein
MRLVRIMLHESFLTNPGDVADTTVIEDGALVPSVGVIRIVADNICASALQYEHESTVSQSHGDSPV